MSIEVVIVSTLALGGLGVVLAAATHVVLAIAVLRSPRSQWWALIPPLAWLRALVHPKRRWHRTAAVLGFIGAAGVGAATSVLIGVGHAMAVVGSLGPPH